MEMPIVVVITLFVAVVVGLGIILFSRDVLVRSQQNLDEFGNDDEIKDKVVAVNNPGSETFRSLALQCAKDLSGNIDRELCVIVKGTGVSSSNSINGDTVEAKGRTFTIQSSVATTATAAFMYYDPAGRITIES